MNNEIKILDSLSKYYFQFGIFTEDGMKTVNVNVVNTDNSVSQVDMKLSDVMYFTEYGTIKLPGQRILENSMAQLNKMLDRKLDDLITNILLNDYTETDVENHLRVIALNIQDYIRNYTRSIIKRNNVLGSIITEDKDFNKYLYDLNDLSKYIKCKLMRI